MTSVSRATAADLQPGLEGGEEAMPRLFNGVIAGAAIAACAELGLFQELENGGRLKIDELARKRSLSTETLRLIFRCLASVEVVVLDVEGRISPGPMLLEAEANQGYFLWLLGGYGDMLSKLGSLLSTEPGHASPWHRDRRRIALAGRDYGRRFVDPRIEPLIGSLEFKKLADLGCGSGERIIRSVQRYGGQGIGIDIDSEVARLASRAVANAGLTEKIEIFTGDVGNLQPNPDYSSVDCLMSFFMGHDLWPESRCVEALSNLRHRFEGVRRFLLCDTFRDDSWTDAPPIFSLGFELTHAVMGQHIPTVEEWEPALEAAGWRLLRVIPIDIPSSAAMELTPV